MIGSNLFGSIPSKNEEDVRQFVWDKKSIDQKIYNIDNGMEDDMPNPFYENNKFLRRNKIRYNYSKEEIQEVKRCKESVVYFAENYCKIQSQGKIITIKPYDYQKEIMSAFQEDNLSIVLSSRQSGKCINFDTKVTVRVDGKIYDIMVFELYFQIMEKHHSLSMRERLRRLLYEVYSEAKKDDILFLMNLYENFEFLNSDINENNDLKKIQKTVETDGVEILSDTGFVDITHIHRTQPYKVWEVSTVNRTLKCADRHYLFDDNMVEIFVKDLKVGQMIQTCDGLEEVTLVKNTGDKLAMFDFSIDDENHCYYANGMLSHNTTIVSIFLIWYAIFHNSRTILTTAHKGSAVSQTIYNIKLIYEQLPFFMKPGINTWQMTGITFENRCRIIGSTTTADSGRSFPVNLLFCLDGETTNITIRDKVTGEITHTTMEDLYKMIETDEKC